MHRKNQELKFQYLKKQKINKQLYKSIEDIMYINKKGSITSMYK